MKAAAHQLSTQNEVRKIAGLRWVELRDQGPFNSSPKSKISAVKRGLAYERVVGRTLKRLITGGELLGELHLQQWILFADAGGVQWARPDAYIRLPSKSQFSSHRFDGILLIEVKLTQSDSATHQLLGLYLPLLRRIYNVPILCLQVCKNLRYVPSKLIERPAELIEHPGPGVFTWHLS